MTPTSEFIHMPDPEYPGWHTWRMNDGARFNAHALGRMIIRTEGERSARLRLLDLETRHSNLHSNVHGGITLALIDVAMFAAIYTVLGADTAGSVTLDLHNQFIGAGKIGEPLDAVCDIMKETRRLVFLRGTVEQGEHLVSNYVGTLRKPSTR
ncbi:PaaI family thioesterase [Novosphingobium album (ex Hu et al. 2023)]|uniref:PaaI family thioesterase n=1 Tax=Novosphingobium album (ex Hu et al. 2023) TaxID=2930093 RepID=A0ABT0AXW2_9SPHN|nr:PaaI family thioesterase [Novosphingobium album (ex Hu et al. 2023)]MCJ2177656.1 PaaI family thioesterase [Novosphingobium album (ex Hu et al. 2023)]